MVDIGTTRQVLFRNAHLVVHEVGSGPPLGHLHGSFGNPWPHPMLQALSQEFRVVAPTLPGFGDSPRCDDLGQFYDWIFAASEVVDSLGLTGQPLVASSVGAMLALEVAAMRPEAFSHLVLIAPLGLWNDDEPVADLFGRPIGEEQAVLSLNLEATNHLYETDPAMLPEARIEAGIQRHATRTRVGELTWGIPDHGLRSRLHRVTCPVTLIWGAGDRLVPPSYLDLFAEALPKVVGTHVIAAAGHQADWDQAEQVAALVSDAIG